MLSTVEQDADHDATPFNHVLATVNAHLKQYWNCFFLGSSVHFVLRRPLHDVADVRICTSSMLLLSVPSPLLSQPTDFVAGSAASSAAAFLIFVVPP